MTAAAKDTSFKRRVEGYVHATYEYFCYGEQNQNYAYSAGIIITLCQLWLKLCYHRPS